MAVHCSVDAEIRALDGMYSLKGFRLSQNTGVSCSVLSHNDDKLGNSAVSVNQQIGVSCSRRLLTMMADMTTAVAVLPH